MILNMEQTATILAALRFYQWNGQGDPDKRNRDIHNIATDSGELISLNDEGIDTLCEMINHKMEFEQAERDLESAPKELLAAMDKIPIDRGY